MLLVSRLGAMVGRSILSYSLFQTLFLVTSLLGPLFPFRHWGKVKTGGAQVSWQDHRIPQWQNQILEWWHNCSSWPSAVLDPSVMRGEREVAAGVGLSLCYYLKWGAQQQALQLCPHCRLLLAGSCNNRCAFFFFSV